jgi:hypothetical protein
LSLSRRYNPSKEFVRTVKEISSEADVWLRLSISLGTYMVTALLAVSLAAGFSESPEAVPSDETAELPVKEHPANNARASKVDRNNSILLFFIFFTS